MADWIIRDGLRILGYHRVEAFHEAQADSICGICSGWGHGEHNCASPNPPVCPMRTRPPNGRAQVRCRGVQGVRVACVQVVTRCPNCRGPQGARSPQCPRKKEALEKANNWEGKAAMEQSPPHPDSCPKDCTASPPGRSQPHTPQ